MSLLVQDLLKTCTLAQLKKKHGINFRIQDHKISLNYDMIEAHPADPVACQCRGAVLYHEHDNLDENTVVGETQVMCRTMDRFFNLGQPTAANIDFTAPGVKFYEKHDGTMCALYYDFIAEKWCVATRSVPEANLPIDGFNTYTFRTLFEHAVHDTTGMYITEWIKAENLQKDRTYVFELCTPMNRIVIKHEQYKLVLLAIRNTDTGHEYEIDCLKHVPSCEHYNLSSLVEMVEFVQNRDPEMHEGIVVRDAQFRRVKVKNPGYLALSRIKDAAVSSPRALLELCLLGTLDDVVPLLPDYIVSTAEEIREKLTGYLQANVGVYEKFYTEAQERCIGDVPEKKFRKELALVTKQNHGDMGYIMKRYQGKVGSYREFVETHIDPKTGRYHTPYLAKLARTLGLQ